jgi:signal transduction histidine kinase
MPEGGTITLRAKRATGDRRPETASDTVPRPPSPVPCLEIAVSDAGQGIPPENLDRIFDPFFTTKDGGTGLGLAIARQIAVDHGGSLTCESMPGTGTTFRLLLPTFDGGSRQ